MLKVMPKNKYGNKVHLSQRCFLLPKCEKTAKTLNIYYRAFFVFGVTSKIKK